MKIFISWSGARSKAVAEAMRQWIRCVLQATRPWLSSRDLGRGTVWFNEINEQLKDAFAGIICLTQENKERPWILFEAGALAKGLTSNRVCTFLVDLEPKDVREPLAQFNHTVFSSESMWSLVLTLNELLEDNGLDQSTLREVFDTYSPRFEAQFRKCLDENPPTDDAQPRPESDVLAEILNTTRSLSNRMGQIESRLSVSDLASRKRGGGDEQYYRAMVQNLMLSNSSDDNIVEYLRERESIPKDIASRLVERSREELNRILGVPGTGT